MGFPIRQVRARAKTEPPENPNLTKSIPHNPGIMSFRNRKPHLPSEPNVLEKKHFKIRPRTRASGNLAVRVLAIVLALFVVLVHYFERVRVKSALESCQWLKWEPWSSGAKPHRIVFIADPQLVDDHTYPTLPRVVSHYLRRLSDNYLLINNRFMQNRLDPDTTIFLGDLFDGGRDWEDDMWLQEYDRFNRIFPKRGNRRQIRSLPGNHDIGFQNILVARQNRFAAYFGEPNDWIELGNHTIVQIDTISLSHEDEAVSKNARNFVAGVAEQIDPAMPRIVLSHVPFYRDPKVEVCAPGRELKKRFPLMRGVQYQTVIDYHHCADILARLSPKIVFSGDDHDYCDVTHLDYNDNTRKLAREISCKTASMTNGIKYPAYQLLSLYNPDKNRVSHDPQDHSTFATKMCYLPSPYRGLKFYAFQLVLSLAVLAACTVFPEKVDYYLDSANSLVLPNFSSVPREDAPMERRWRVFALQSAVVFLFVWVLYWGYNRL